MNVVETGVTFDPAKHWIVCRPIAGGGHIYVTLASLVAAEEQLVVPPAPAAADLAPIVSRIDQLAAELANAVTHPRAPLPAPSIDLGPLEVRITSLEGNLVGEQMMRRQGDESLVGMLEQVLARIAEIEKTQEFIIEHGLSKAALTEK